MRTASRVILAACACLCAGCGGDSRTPAELKAAAAKARDEAKAAQEAKDPKGADRAAKQAEAAAERAKAIAERDAKKEAEASEEARAAAGLAKETADLAKEARGFAELAREEAELEAKVGSLKAKAYRAARKAAVGAVFLAFAVAAEKAGKDGLDSLPSDLAGLARCAADVAQHQLGRKPLPDGSHDWAGIASDMRRLAVNPPVKLPFYLAAGFCLLGRDDMALWEIEAMDVSRLSDPFDYGVYRIFRGLIYHNLGFKLLAKREFESLAEPVAPNGKAEIGRAVEVFCRCVLISIHMREKDYAMADLEIMRLVQTDPNSPVAVYFTGERLAADGQYEKAANTLESVTEDPNASPEEKWLAERVMARARDIRDRKGAAEPLFCNKEFMCEVLVCIVRRAVREGKAPKSLDEFLDSGRALSRKLVENLGGGKGARE